MADNLKWFKVWTSITDDPDFLEMSLEDIARWVLLGAYIRKHGENGQLIVSDKVLANLLRCEIVTLNVTITKIHNVVKTTNTCNDKNIVTFKKWHKYQIDNSSERVAKFRENVTEQDKIRRDKIRRDKIRRDKIRLKDIKTPFLEGAFKDTTNKNTNIMGKQKKIKTPIPDNFTISDRVKKWAEEKGYINLQEHLESFISKCKAKGYEYVDWDSAFMEAIRGDWAKITLNGGNDDDRFNFLKGDKET